MNAETFDLHRLAVRLSNNLKINMAVDTFRRFIIIISAIGVGLFIVTILKILGHPIPDYFEELSMLIFYAVAILLLAGVFILPLLMKNRRIRYYMYSLLGPYKSNDLPPDSGYFSYRASSVAALVGGFGVFGLVMHLTQKNLNEDEIMFIVVLCIAATLLPVFFNSSTKQ